MRVFRECLSTGFEGGMWDLIVLIPDHCLSIYVIAVCNELWKLTILKVLSFHEQDILTISSATKVHVLPV